MAGDFCFTVDLKFLVFFWWYMYGIFQIKTAKKWHSWEKHIQIQQTSDISNPIYLESFVISNWNPVSLGFAYFSQSFTVETRIPHRCLDKVWLPMT